MNKTDKATALKNYKDAKAEYIKNPTNKNWKKFCDRKRACMLLGIRI